ncbi:helix-turn-helix domain-containing protein [uncultured Pseudoteredinibacter sp.]|uniref:helix-turn-helix domain-containing protein n=1 Tax=uncultured Pseudoteredinibacter sp. TaxID=1641701 RepID=UPI00260166CB|nr:helix-turn-helix domain-containing protein [uncultured Pseudoteredinibacter sp.]
MSETGDKPPELDSSEAGLPLGRRLQLLRERNGWSQRELAKRSGVTNSVISTIEQGRVSPSISSLEKILSGFPVSLREFFTFDPDAEAPVFFDVEEMEPRQFEGLQSRRLFAHQGVAVTHVVYQGSLGEMASSSPSLYQRDGMTVGVIISGQLEVTVGGQVRLLNAGEGYQFDQSRPHCIRNLNEEECVVLSVSC